VKSEDTQLVIALLLLIPVVFALSCVPDHVMSLVRGVTMLITGVSLLYFGSSLKRRY
jgi:hypothetical protein